MDAEHIVLWGYKLFAQPLQSVESEYRNTVIPEYRDNEKAKNRDNEKLKNREQEKAKAGITAKTEGLYLVASDSAFPAASALAAAVSAWRVG